MIHELNCFHKKGFSNVCLPNFRSGKEAVQKVKRLFEASFSQSLFKIGGGKVPFFSAFCLSSYLYRSDQVALCKTNQEDPFSVDGSEESPIQGFTRKELQVQAPNLFKYLSTEAPKSPKEREKVDIKMKARAFQELFEISKKIIEEVRGKEITLFIEGGGSKKSQPLSKPSTNPSHEKGDFSTGELNRIPPDLITSLLDQIIRPKSQKVVVMRGVEASSNELIHLVRAAILEKVINEANGASFVFTVDIEDNSSKSTFLQKVINEANAVSFVSMVDIDDNSSKSTFFKKVINAGLYVFSESKSEKARKERERIVCETIRFLGFSPEEIKKSVNPPPLMILVNKPNASSGELSLNGLNHLTHKFDPEKTNFLFDTAQSLQKKKLDVKISCPKNQIEKFLGDLDKLKDLFSEQIRKLPEECTLEEFKQILDEEILPTLNYSERLCDFASSKSIDDYLLVREVFEENLAKRLTQWIDAVCDGTLDPLELRNLIIKLPDEISSSPLVLRSIIEKLRTKVLPKDSAHVAGFVTIAIMGLVAFSTIAWIAIPLGVIAGLYLNAKRTDQRLLHLIGEVTKGYFPKINKWVHEKNPFEELTDLYDRSLQNTSDQAIKYLEIRDRERSRLNSLLLEINEILKKGKYYDLSHLNKCFVREEKTLFQEITNDFLSAIADPFSLDYKKKREERYKTSYGNIFKWIEKLASMSKDKFSALRDSDQDQLMSKIKSLKIILRRLHSVHKKYLEKSKISNWAELEESQMDRTQESWIEMGLNKGKNILDFLTPQFIKARPMTNEAKG